MKKLSILASLTLLSPFVYADTDPVSLRLKTSEYDIATIYIQSNEDRVTINNVIVNRGNCEVLIDSYGRNIMDPMITTGANRSITLKFGQEQDY